MFIMDNDQFNGIENDDHIIIHIILVNILKYNIIFTLPFEIYYY